MEWNDSSRDLRRQVADGSGLGSREPGGAELSRGQRQQPLGRQVPVEQVEKSAVDRGRRGSRELLVQDALCERPEVPSGSPREMEAVFEMYVADFIRSHSANRSAALRVVVNMFESEVSPLLQEVMDRRPNTYLKAYLKA